MFASIRVDNKLPFKRMHADNNITVAVNELRRSLMRNRVLHFPFYFQLIIPNAHFHAKKRSFRIFARLSRRAQGKEQKNH